MMNIVRVELGDRGYDIRIGTDMVFDGLDAMADTQALVLTDATVDPLYGDRCEAALRAQNMEVSRYVLRPGEATKSLTNLEAIYDEAFACGLDRRSTMVALGGGVVGDLTGFAAATFLRGIRLIQVPTTLLAMVDSSVGGKTAVNVRQGKNLIGAFYQPAQVVVDLSVLGSLSDREYRAGLAEVVKYGVIMDAEFFTMLEAEQEALLARAPDLLARVVQRCCEIKADVVRQDEQEGGLRAILNFGHTLGHAVEREAGYGAVLHGEAVSIGMVYAADLSVRTTGLPAKQRDRLVGLLAGLGLPLSLSDVPLSWPAIRRAMAVDKKTRNAVPRFVLAEDIGRVRCGCEVEDAVLEDAFCALTPKT